MNWLSSLVPSWVEGIFHIVSRVGKLIWGIFIANFAVLVLVMAMLYFAWQIFGPLLDNVVVHADAVLSLVGGSINGMQAMIDAGWPAEFAKGVNYANQHVPLAELFLMITSLMTLWVICSILRIIKSFIPTLS